MEIQRSRNNAFRGLLLLVPLFTLLLAALLMQGCMDQANGDQTPHAEEKQQAIPVEAAEVVSGDVAAVYTGTATLEADEQATVVSQITGVVLEIHAEEGDYVEAGQVLARIETERYRLEVEMANAALKRLETDYRRKKELFERKLVSAEAFEHVSAEFEAQKAVYDLARLDLAYTEITAPISGYVSERLVRVGNLVTLHEPVYRITSHDPLLAVLHVPERELRVLRKGLEVSVVLDAWPGEVFSGEVIRISPDVDAKTGTFRVTADIIDREGKLRPGLFGRVEVRYDLHRNVPVIPRSAVISEDRFHHVFVIESDGKAVRRVVDLGYENNGLIEVSSGLQTGDTIVTAGKGSLSDGVAVEVVRPESRQGV